MWSGSGCNVDCVGCFSVHVKDVAYIGLRDVDEAEQYIYLLWNRTKNAQIKSEKQERCNAFTVVYTLPNVLHCKKNIHISTDILRRVFHILTYTFVWVNRLTNEARAHIAMRAWALLFRRFTDTNGTGSVKMWKARHKISMDIHTVYIITVCVGLCLCEFSWNYSTFPHWII